jgi:hypothetical protein
MSNSTSSKAVSSISVDKCNIGEIEIEHLKDLVIQTSNIAWDHYIKEPHLLKWLNNFKGEILNDKDLEQKIALLMLLNFTFYTIKEVRILCKEIYKEYIHCKLLENKNSEKNIEPYEKQIKDIIDNTRFVALGNDSESGTNIIYFFRQENELAKKSFDLTALEYENVVFIDDVTISGTQANRYMKLKIKSIKAKHYYLLSFIATKEALKCCKKENENVKLIYASFLDERCQCFSESSYVFASGKNSLLPLAENMCKGYGKIIVKNLVDMKDYPIGYSDGAYLFGFYYNTPNNSLPIIWGKDNWHPIFERHEKIYHKESESLDGEKYI